MRPYGQGNKIYFFGKNANSVLVSEYVQTMDGIKMLLSKV